MASFCAAINRDLVSPFKLPFLAMSKFSHVRFRLFVVGISIHMRFFFHFCFLVIFVLLMLVLCVLFLVAAFSSLFCFFVFVVFELLYRCIDVIFNTFESSSNFFTWHIKSVCVVSGTKGLMYRHGFSCSLVHLLKFFPDLLREWSRVSYKGDSSSIYPFDEVFALVWFRVVFSFFFVHSFIYFLKIFIIIIIIIYSFRVFHIRVSRWFFTGVWVTARLLKSPGLVSGFWPFSTMQSFG